MSFSSSGGSCAALNFGMRYGPIRTASPSWRGGTPATFGTSAPVTMPPRAITWWQPAQSSVNASLPRPPGGPARAFLVDRLLAARQPARRRVDARDRRPAERADVRDERVDVAAA